MRNKRQAGFTLIELLVVIAIIGMLASMILVSLNGARAKARNSRQKADLSQLSKALELYYNGNSAYPSTSGSWHGDASGYGSYGYGAAGYIPGLVPTYVASLPANPNLNKTLMCASNQTGYLYISDGKDYKLLAHCSEEGSWDSTDTFYDSVRTTWAWQISTPGGKGW